MDPDARLVLRPDAVIVEATELDAAARARVDCNDDDFVVSLPRSRQTSKVVDSNTADLLGRFRTAASFNQVVAAFSGDHGVAVEEVREAAQPLVARFLRKGFLTSAQQQPEGAEATFGYGQRHGELTFVRPLQIADDTEVYLARRLGDWVVAKVEGRDADGAAVLDNESAILRRLGGNVGPALLHDGDLDGRRCLVLEWIGGVNASRAAAEWRIREERAALRALLARIASAYAELHARDVVHADVHPRNVLVSRDGGVRLIDFGLARDGRGERAAPRRAGVAYFYEPELARALIAGERSPDATVAGEQFALAAMLYQLATGGHTSDFSLEREPMLQQIAAAEVRPFEDRNVAGWPALESILRRALEPTPERRFGAVDELRDAVAAAAIPSLSRARAGTIGGASQDTPGLRRADLSATEDFLGATALDGPMLSRSQQPPTASVYCGAAGIAYALYRIALSREDALILSTADVWCCRAAREIDEHGAIYTDEAEFAPDALGRTSPYHTASGVYAVQALIARARGDSAGQYVAAKQFVETSAPAANGNDIAVGRSGTLVVAALLVEAGCTTCHAKQPALLDLGLRTLTDLWNDLDDAPPLAEARRGSGGAAHGWAGYLYATLAWCRASGRPVPDGCRARLDELAALAVPHGRGLRWPWDLVTDSGKKPRHMPGWCNGSAGQVLLWNLAASCYAEPRFAELAEASAWHCWDARRRISTLCCGLTGRAYALLNLYRASGDDVWRRRAVRLGESALAKDSYWDQLPNSLFYGRTGLALLQQDLTTPDTAAFPFVETGLGV